MRRVPLAVQRAMGRTRAKKTPASKASVAPPQTAALLEKAQALVVQCDYELAARFAKRILESEPDNAEAREILGVSLLETDDIDGAKQVCVYPSFARTRSHPSFIRSLIHCYPSHQRRHRRTCIWHNCQMTIRDWL